MHFVLVTLLLFSINRVERLSYEKFKGCIELFDTPFKVLCFRINSIIQHAM